MTDSTAASTPLPRRRLGLRLHKGARTTPGSRLQSLQEATTPHSAADQSNNNETPRASQPQKPKATSTNCRRLGLSRRRTDLSKKRLEFIASNAAAAEEVTNNTEKLEWRQRKILELETDIATWKCGFIAAINDLQALVPDPVTKEKLLTELKLPLELMQYFEED